jgi:serine/threonine protein kinase
MAIKDYIIGNNYKLKKQIGSGSFGKIYLGIDLYTKEKVAIKMEENSKSKHLKYEYKIYKDLKGGMGIPTVRWFGYHHSYNVLVMDLLDRSLDKLFVEDCDKKFTLKTVLRIIDQMIVRIELLHNHGYIHRDIKPANFIIGRKEDSDVVFLIDFGLSKRYKDARSDQHIKYRDDKSLVGTARYVSVNTHNGIEQSRRDDLESLGYVFIYFLKGELPWQGLKADNKRDKYAKIAKSKRKISLETLCDGCPPEFIEYFLYCRSLKFKETPNYKKIRILFRNLFYAKGYDKENFEYDWIKE